MTNCNHVLAMGFLNILHIPQKYMKKDFHMVMSYTCGTI